MLIYKKKLEATKNRSGLNIKSGRVMMEVKDRDWLFSMIELMGNEIEMLEKMVVNKNEILRGVTSVK